MYVCHTAVFGVDSKMTCDKCNIAMTEGYFVYIKFKCQRLE